ncbi:hypothetical protein GWI33_006705 [Rhynchophorus ferrugineus]|uniref:Elongation of very long chain fatty acids protein n=1 Tax=Rhynchophorus ferrugineus TaxID=354439 RepID=A0A834IU39_RHYFE|nr:hypothetical protein GWI33_006705 [Rhynchophorus ferrugineus]
MATVSYNKTLHQFYLNLNYLISSKGDPRTHDLLFVKSPLPILGILTLYLLFVLKWGPEYMKNKKPYEMKNVLMIYNLTQVLCNFYMFKETIAIWKEYSWICQPIDTSNSESSLTMIFYVHFYFLNKISDLLDTVFFVLRKKQSQISFLHVFHHTIMVVLSWIFVKYVPNGHGTFIGIVNTFVHVILYLYYFLAALGPSIQKYLWWKKYITMIQLIQFGMIVLHQLLIFLPGCNYPKWVTILSLPNTIAFYYLFADFYKKSYTRKNSLKSKSKPDLSKITKKK